MNGTNTPQTEATRARSALQAIPPDLPRDQWVKAGMAAHASGLSLEDFDSWSAGAGAPVYDQVAVREVWRSFKDSPAGVGPGSLIHMAKQHGWTDTGEYHHPSAEELALRQKRLEKQAAADQAKQAKAASHAQAIWQVAIPAPARHPYLVRKGVGPTSTLRKIDAQQATQILGYRPQAKGVPLQGRLLVAPIMRAGVLSTVELIDGQGNKAALRGRGTKDGGYWATDRLPEIVTNVAICEGVADAITIRMAGAELAVAALSNSNLVKVAQEMRRLFPGAVLTIVADLVKNSVRPDPHAVAAARAIGGLLAVPSFGPGREPHQKDINDLMVTFGLDAVQQCLAGAQAVLDDDQREQAQPQGDDEEPDHHRNAPVPSKECLYGLIGDVASAGSENTEANTFAIAAAMLAYLGVAVGRGPYMPIGDDWNHARLFMVHVGRSSRGRKGTAKKLMLRIDKAIKELREPLAPQVHRGGLSSREGLAMLIHDGIKEGRNEVPAIHDKRLLVVESEFANVLHQSKRDGNTLSPALRDAWDGISIKPATKTSRVWASSPHIGLLCDVTPSELMELMHARELTNGFANRFLFFWAESDKVLPFPKYTPDEVIHGIADRMKAILEFAGADRFVERDTMRMEFSPEAAALYAKLYKGELRDRSAGERITALLDRRAPMLLRLAMLFALTDCTFVISAQHINAAMAWVRYWVDSVKFVFQSGADEAMAERTSDTANKILDYLKNNGQAARKDLTRNCFQGNTSKATIDSALDELLTGNPPQITIETQQKTKGTPGAQAKIYKLATNNTNNTNNGVNTGFSGDFDSVRTVRTIRTNPQDERSKRNGSYKFVEFVNGENGPQTRMDAHCSYGSYSSLGNSEHDEEVF